MVIQCSSRSIFLQVQNFVTRQLVAPPEPEPEQEMFQLMQIQQMRRKGLNADETYNGTDIGLYNNIMWMRQEFSDVT